MPARCTGFTVNCRKRSTGAPYWLVSGTLNGRQLRKEFSLRATALAYAEARNTELRGGTAEESTVLTHLKPDQVREAENVIANLGRSHPDTALSDIAEYFRQCSSLLPLADAAALAPALKRLHEKFPDVTPAAALGWFTEHYRVPTTSVTLKIALENYLADVARRAETGSLSRRQFLGVGRELSRLEKHFEPTTLLANLDQVALQEFLRISCGATFSNKTWNNRRGYLTAFLNFCRQENWIESNPAKKLRVYRKKELVPSVPVILRLEAARTLMAAVEKVAGGRLVPYFVLCLFCGVRPDWKDGEMNRLTPENLKIGEKKIKLRAAQTKTKKARETTLQPNVLDWLTRYPLERFPLRAVNHRKLLKKIRERFKIGHDVLRHTYCSMLVGKFRSVGDASLQAGNSEDILWNDYLDLVDQAEASSFWEIRPTLQPEPERK